MLGKRKLQKSFGALDKAKFNRQQEVPGRLGVGFGGERRVEVAGREGYVWVRLRGDLSELVQAYNDQVSPVYDLPVLVTRDETDKGKWKVLSRDYGQYGNWGSSAYIAKHAAQHSFDPSSPGGDPVWVWGRQFMPLAAIPSGSSGGPNVIIQRSTYYQNKDWHCAGGTGTANIIPNYNPTGTQSRMVLVYLDLAGNPQLLGGSTYFDPSITGQCAVLPYLPDLPDTSDIPIAGIRLPSGSSTITWNNIYDLRPHIVADGFIPTGTSGHTIQKDDVPYAHRDALNFVGSGFTVWNDADSTNVSGSASGHRILSEATPQTQRPDLDFAHGMVAYDDATNAKTVVSGTVATYPKWSIPYAGSDQYLTNHIWYRNYDDGYQTAMIIGGLGDYANSWYNYSLNLVKGDDVSFGDHLATWGYGGGMHPLFVHRAANGLESSPEYLTANDPIFEEQYYSFATGTGYSTWAEVAEFNVKALEDQLNSFASYMYWETYPTGGFVGRVRSLELMGRKAEFIGDVAIPTGSSVIPYPGYYYGHQAAIYPDGTWRSTRDGDDLVYQRKESDTWTTKIRHTDLGMMRQIDTWHAYGGFQDESETISIAAVDTWTHVTNATNDLWTGLEATGMTLSGDIMTFTYAGDYVGNLSMSLSGLTGKDFQIRLYNITQASQMGYKIGITTSGANNYANVNLPLYIEANAGDQMRVEVQCTTDGSDPTFKHAVFHITYLHD